MATIEDLKTWVLYRKHGREVYQHEKSIDDPSIPESIRALFTKDQKLEIGDVSHSVLRDELLTYCKTFAPDFKIDEFNTVCIDQIIKWLRNDDPILKANKGILLRGGVGSGKTTLFKALRELINRIVFYDFSIPYEFREYSSTLPKRFNITTAAKISSDFAIDGFAILDNNITGRKTYTTMDYVRGTLLIDDFGSEQIPSHYGSVVNIIGEIITRRYEANALTYLTSNLSIEEIKTVYGMRVYDRLREMVNDVLLLGESRRR